LPVLIALVFGGKFGDTVVDGSPADRKNQLNRVLKLPNGGIAAGPDQNRKDFV